MTNALKIRKELKAKKPDFLRQETHKKSGIEKKWRKPKGSDSKMRLKLRGYRRSVTKGWKSPKAVRGLSAEGLEIVYVVKESELQAIDVGKQLARLPAVMGMRKKFALVKKAKELGVKLLNFKSLDDYITKVEEKLKAKKAKKEKMKKAVEKKKEEKKEDTKKTEKKEDKPAEKSADSQDSSLTSGLTSSVSAKADTSSQARMKEEKREEKKPETKEEPKKPLSPEQQEADEKEKKRERDKFLATKQ